MFRSIATRSIRPYHRPLSTRASQILDTLDFPAASGGVIHGVYDGQWYGSGDPLPSVCPTTGEVLGHVSTVRNQPRSYSAAYSVTRPHPLKRSKSSPMHGKHTSSFAVSVYSPPIAFLTAQKPSLLPSEAKSSDKYVKRLQKRYVGSCATQPFSELLP